MTSGYVRSRWPWAGRARSGRSCGRTRRRGPDQDPHVGADWGSGDPVTKLAAAVEAVRAVDAGPAAILVSGDLADHATDDEYDTVRELLAPLGAPLYVLPGNHDDRDALHRHFGVRGAGGVPVQYATDLGGLRLVVLDSTRPGEDRGELDAARLSWLDETLRAAPDAPTLVALHHTPVTTGVAALDEAGLPDGDRRALGEVVARHHQVLRIVGGHIHQTVVGEVRGRPVLAAPSTYDRFRLRPGSGELELVEGPSGFAVHTLLEGELVSHVEPVG